MITGNPAKAVAVAILGKPLGDQVIAVSVRQPSDEEQRRAPHGLTVGEVWTFEMGGPKIEPREFVVSWK